MNEPCDSSSTRPLYVTTSWDDGSSLDTRLSELLCRHGFQGTFYIPKHLQRRGLSDGEVYALGQHFEIGGHSTNHPNFTQVAEDTIRKEVFQSKQYLEDLMGRSVTSFAYPYGAFDARAIQLLQQAGFVLGRTTRAFSEPGADPPLAQGVTLQAAPYGLAALLAELNQPGSGPFAKSLAQRLAAFGNSIKWSELALITFDIAQIRGGVWHLWGHSWEITENGLWQELEVVLSRISRHPGVRYVRNCEIPSAGSKG